MTKDGAKDLESAKDGSRHYAIAGNIDIEGTVSGFVEAVGWIAVGGIDCDAVS